LALAYPLTVSIIIKKVKKEEEEEEEGATIQCRFASRLSM
jgi:hypothetical protein